MDRITEYRLQNLNAFVLQILNEPVRSATFYAATTPEQIVTLATVCGFNIRIDDLVELLRSHTGKLLIDGRNGKKPFNHLCQVLGV